MGDSSPPQGEDEIKDEGDQDQGDGLPADDIALKIAGQLHHRRHDHHEQDDDQRDDVGEIVHNGFVGIDDAFGGDGIASLSGKCRRGRNRHK